MPDAEAAAPRETFFIVVAGAMNPAIHHPQWYRTIGAIDEAELKAALQVPFNQTTPFVSQVQFGSPPLTVTCQPQQWWIQANKADAWGRMLDIASLVFTKLGETPVNSYGLTAQRHIDTEILDTKSVLAESIAEMGLGFPSGKKSSGSNVTLTVTEDDFVATSTIQPSVLSERAIFILYQCLYQAPKVPGGYFDLGKLLRGRFERYQPEQKRIFEEMVAAVNARVAKANSNE
jgi:hypothetical protein